MSDPVAARRRALEQCIVLRFKIVELTHLLALAYAVADGYVPPRAQAELADSLLTTVLASTAVSINSIIDPKNLDLLEIICLLYPDEQANCRAIWDRDVQPAFGILRKYRNKVVAHADPVRGYLRTRFEYDRQQASIGPAAKGILDIANKLLDLQNAEPTEFHAIAENVLLEVDLKQPHHKLNRKILRKLGILPSGPFHKVY